ncbi:MAG TPA: glycogen debranching protein, partial [Armatimonadetes bacterium]|nr:glycogen debranching protein [Armatimonadota bacterium]
GGDRDPPARPAGGAPGREGDAPNVALTWMDAKVGDHAVTARRGKPVEVNALWLQCLWFVAHLARAFNDVPMARLLEKLHKRALEQFHAKFWNERRGCLYDVLTDDAPDASVRPNQVIALMLPSMHWSDDRANAILSVIVENLLTPVGLRTLAPDEDGYCGRYIGDQVHRDTAYHQGTVWAWLIGPFVTAYVRHHKRSQEARLQAVRWLVGFIDHLRSAGLGTISEIFDGDPPYHPRGCIAQAWSVAEIIRALVEDVCNYRPPPLWDECNA